MAAFRGKFVDEEGKEGKLAAEIKKEKDADRTRILALVDKIEEDQRKKGIW